MITLTFCRVKKKETDLLNSMDRANALEEELRNLGNKLSRTEDEQRRTQDQLRVNNSHIAQYGKANVSYNEIGVWQICLIEINSCRMFFRNLKV